LWQLAQLMVLFFERMGSANSNAPKAASSAGSLLLKEVSTNAAPAASTPITTNFFMGCVQNKDAAFELRSSAITRLYNSL
jgi:hypothetical protein